MRWGPPLSLKPLPEALRVYQSAVEARPLLLEDDRVQQLLEVQQLLLQALQGLLEASEETADYLGLTGRARDQLRRASQRPLRLGCVRPDVIWDADGRPWICEINARFAVNGFLVSAYLADQFSLLTPHRPACDGESIRSALRLAPGSVIVKGREPGWDIHQLSQEHHAPIGAHCPGDAAEVVLELHQDELVELADVPAMPYWNDLRTQWLGHDKRMLGRLADPGVTQRWLGAKAERLAAAIIPTRPVSEDADQDSVLKPNRSGKGAGLVFGADKPLEQWRKVLREAPREWVVQPVRESVCWEGERLVATLLSRDQQSLGLGIVRASAERVVNVSGGGRILFPMLDAG